VSGRPGLRVTLSKPVPSCADGTDRTGVPNATRDEQMTGKSKPRFRFWRVLLTLAGTTATVAIAATWMLRRPFSEPAWVEAPPHRTSIYESSLAAGAPVVSPFHLEIQPMHSLLLVNFEGDPDRIYRGLEPQAFDDEVHGRGLLVIGWRVDGRVDVFHDPALRLDPDTYGIAGKGLHVMAPRDLANAHLHLGPAGAQANFDFPDLEGRRVRLVVRETDTRPRRPFALLAPMGTDAADPPALPLVYVKDFYFVRHAGSEIRIEFDGRPHDSDAIPLVLDGTRMTFVRYSTRPFIVTWNPTVNARAEVLAAGAQTVPDMSVLDANGVRYELTSNGPFREIRRMSRRKGGQEVTVDFTPPIPHLLAMRDGADVSGAFRIATEPPAGLVTGTWRSVRQGRRLHLEATPSGGWTPGEAPPMARVLFRMIYMFRTWPATYSWTATLPLPEPGTDVGSSLPLESAWERIER
jgi:hypothetical protein